MPRVLIIGYGNPLRGDDGVGLEAAKRLRADVSDDAVEILAVHQLTPELAEPVSDSALVIFIDASRDGEPGRWKSEEITPDAPSPGTASHHLTPASLLAYARTIFGGQPRAVVFSIAGESFDLTESLSPRVQATLPEIIEQVRGEIARAFSEASRA